MTDDGGFRVITLQSTQTVSEAIANQVAQVTASEGAAPLSMDVLGAFGELLTGAVLYRETMAPTLRVQAIVQSADGTGQIVADSFPEGDTRGLIRRTGDALHLNGAMLQMMRSLPNGTLHRGTVEMKGGSISEGFMSYMQSSEQVAGMLSVGCQLECAGDGSVEVVAAGGYIVQLLPELEENMLMLMTERLKEFRSVDALFDGVASSPDTLMEELLYGMAYTPLDDSPVRFKCQCSRARVMASLATLPPADIEEMVREGKNLEMACDYCGTDYEVHPTELRGLTQPS